MIIWWFPFQRLPFILFSFHHSDKFQRLADLRIIAVILANQNARFNPCPYC